MSPFDIDDDVLLHIFTFLEIPDILAMRQTCKRLSLASRTYFVWYMACINHVISKGLPFADLSIHPLSEMTQEELEHRTYRAYRLSQTWSSQPGLGTSTTLRPRQLSTAQDRQQIFDIRFLPGTGGRSFLTVSRGIWFQISIWGSDESGSVQKLTTWGPKGAVISGFTLNEDWKSPATLAVSISRDDVQNMVILSLKHGGEEQSLTYSLETLASFPIVSYRPMMLRGDILAFSDDFSSTVLWNWRAQENAIFQHPPDEHGLWQHDRCVQVVLAHESFLVVRARTVHLFRSLPLSSLQNDPPHPSVACHSFGWTDAICARTCRKQHAGISEVSYTNIRILACEEGDDPWSRQRNFHFYELARNPEFDTGDPESSPYIFPPTLLSRSPTRREFSRCQEIILGPHGTAIWILPQDRTSIGLVNPDLVAPPEPTYPLVSRAVSSPTHETLVVAAFLGTVHEDEDEPDADGVRSVTPQALWTNGLNDWTAIDYDEAEGKIALGTGAGKVMIMSL